MQPPLSSFLSALGFAHRISAMEQFGIESMPDLELATTRLSISDLADMLDAIQISPLEWVITIRRSYFALREWHLPSVYDDIVLVHQLYAKMQVFSHRRR